MDVINPAALWFLMLVAALLLLARTRHARPRRPVANLYLWAPPAAADSFQLTLRRVRRHWLLLLQAAFMLAVIAALTRPAISWRFRTVVLLVDVSSSMAARDAGATRLDMARRDARSMIDRLPSNTRVRLMTAAAAAPTDRGEFAPRDQALARALDDIEVTAASADIARSVETARIAAGRGAEIVVVSDHAVPLGSEDAARWIIVGRPAENRAITVLSARRLPARPDNGVVLATVNNYGSGPVDTAIEITQDQRLLAHRPLHIEPHRRTTVALEVADIGGTIKARLIGSDALSVDDERFTLVAPRSPVDVLLLGNSGFFLEKALSTNPSVSLTVAGDAPVPPAGFDVVVCDGCEALPANAGATFLISGGASIATPSPLIVSLPAHRIASSLDVAGVVGSAARGADLPPGADVILRAGPVPALIAYEHQGRRVAELRMNVEAAGFPLSTTFPVLIDNVIAWLGAREETVTGVLAGEPLRWTLVEGVNGRSVSVLGPDGKARDVTLNGRQLTVTSTERPGVYLVRGTATDRRFVVNPVTDGESDLATTPSTAAPPPLETVEAPSGTGTDVAPLLLAIAFGFLVTEWLARHRAAGGT